MFNLSRPLWLVGITMILISCNGDTETYQSADAPPEKPAPDHQPTVSTAIEGAKPTIADAADDMALVAEETREYKRQRIQMEKDRENGVAQHETERNETFITPAD